MLPYALHVFDREGSITGDNEESGSDKSGIINKFQIDEGLEWQPVEKVGDLSKFRCHKIVGQTDEHDIPVECGGDLVVFMGPGPHRVLAATIPWACCLRCGQYYAQKIDFGKWFKTPENVANVPPITRVDEGANVPISEVP